MGVLIVVESEDRWPFDLPAVEVVGARRYLTEPAFAERKGAVVFNLCRSYAYQSIGYYVSLLAEAATILKDDQPPFDQRVLPSHVRTFIAELQVVGETCKDELAALDCQQDDLTKWLTMA